MLAATIGVIAGLPLLYSGIINTMFFALLVFKIRNKSGNSASIGLVSSIMMSIALILSHIFPGQFNLENLLFGDIFATDYHDIIILLIIIIIAACFIWFNYNNLIITILSRDIAHSRGIRVNRIELLFLTILSFSVLVTVKIVGALLVTSIILIPPMIARLVSKSPMTMICLSVIFAQFMNLCGILLSLYADLPFAPIIILCGGFIYGTLLIIFN
jgi:zinc transport system permease protein